MGAGVIELDPHSRTRSLQFLPHDQAEPTGLRWLPKTIVLPYRLGYVVLWKARVPGLMLDAPLSRLKADSPGLGLALKRLEEGVEVAVIYGQPVQQTLPRVTLFPGAIRYVLAQYTRCYISLTGTFEDYLQRNFTAKQRKNLRREVRLFGEASGGHLCWKEFRTPPEMMEFHRLAREVSRKSYQERLLKDHGFPDDEQFVQDTLELAGRDSVRAYILFLGSKPVSYLYLPAREGILEYVYVGYDPECSALSPGKVLQYLALERLFAEGKFHVFDFGEGKAGQHKHVFATGSVLCADVFYFGRNAKNLLRVLLHGSLTMVSETCSGILEALGLKNDLRKLLRRVVPRLYASEA